MADNGKYQYQLEVARKSDGYCFPPRDVPEARLEMVRAQMTFMAQRRAIASADPRSVDVIDQPVYGGGRVDQIAGLRFSIAGGKEPMIQEFGLQPFQSFAEKVIEDLLEIKALQQGTEVRWRVYARAVAESVAEDGVVVRVRQQPLPLLDGLLDEFLSSATPVGPMNSADHHVFVLDSVLDQARAIGWKGRDLEGGVWLIGNLYRQRQPTFEIFGLVHSLLEIRDPKHERFSLDFSPESFQHVNAQLRLRQKRFGRVGEVLSGVWHSHPFLPSIIDGKEACPQCPLQKECNLTSSFFSKKDGQFHAAVFGSAPYAVELVMGLTPREEFDLRMFCFDGGIFRERGYHRIAALPAMTGHQNFIGR